MLVQQTTTPAKGCEGSKAVPPVSEVGGEFIAGLGNNSEAFQAGI